MRYTSIFSPEKHVTPAQYISELVCQNRANYLKIELPIRFWIRPEWANFLKLQLKFANIYIKKYDASILIKVIKEKNIYSLGAKWIEPYFEKEQELSSQQQKIVNHTRIVDSKGKKKKTKDFGKFDN